MTPLMMVADSSVAAKWFLSDGEADVEAAFDLLVRHRDEEILLAAPTHLKLEVLNALWARRASERQLAEAVADLEAFHLEWVEPDVELLRDATAIAARCRLTIYDSLFTALAARLACDLVTADRRVAVSGACRVHLLQA